MPLYEYRCRVCDTSFQRLRTIADADQSVRCPDGHDDVARALSLVAPLQRRQASTLSAGGGGGGGGCCGGACGCSH